MKKIMMITSWMLVIACMLTIFTFSAQVADDSRDLSQGVTIQVFKVLTKLAPNIDIELEEFNHIIRKCAHFTIYFVLGTLVLNAIRCSYGLSIGYICISFFICFIYAVSDEIHQAFVPGRGPAIFDVIIDSSGSLSGILFYILISKIISPIIRKAVQIIKSKIYSIF